MLTIKSVEPDSIAADLGIVPEDRIFRINGKAIRDILDFHYYISDDFVELSVLKKETQETEFYEITKDYDDQLGLTVAEMKMHACGSDCIFCFVDQNPAGMRSSLYFRDGDYRFSFLQGHFVTLNNVGPRALERIVTQKLSPINVSVHATDPELRVKITGHRKAGLLMEKLEYLIEGGIDLHTQIVLCPDINDGPYLKKSIEDLVAHYPNIITLSVVPVGVTKYQKHKALQKRIQPDYANHLLDFVEGFRQRFMRELGTYFVQPSDEWFLLAHREFPDAEAYEGYPQYENGVGMCRALIDEINELAPLLPARIEQPRIVTIVTGTLAGPVLQKHVAPVLNQITDFEMRVLPVVNDFYGDMVTVSGLLVGQDIRRALQENKETLGDVALLPPYSLNDDHLFLDDLTLPDLQAVVEPPTVVSVGINDVPAWIEQMLNVDLELNHPVELEYEAPNVEKHLL